MEQPPFYIQNHSTLFYFLKKYLYGLNEAPQAWYCKMNIFILDTKISRYHIELNVYTNKKVNHLIILFIYVDGLILTRSGPKILTHVKSNLNKKFKMIELIHFHCFLSLQILQTKENISIS
jgi:hypothetical protein